MFFRTLQEQCCCVSSRDCDHFRFADHGGRWRNSGAPCWISSEPGSSRGQKQTCSDGHDPDGLRNALTDRCEAFEGDGPRHCSHRAKVHDPHNQQDRYRTGTALITVEADAQAVSPGRGNVFDVDATEES